MYGVGKDHESPKFSIFLILFSVVVVVVPVDLVVLVVVVVGVPVDLVVVVVVRVVGSLHVRSFSVS